MQHKAARARFHRHAQTPQAHAAAVPLIVDDQVEHSRPKQEPQHQREVNRQIFAAVGERRNRIEILLRRQRVQ